MSAPSVPVAPINVKIGNERLIKMTENASRKFTDLYNGACGSSATWTSGPQGSRAGRRVINVRAPQLRNKLDDVGRVTICTSQRLYAILRGEEQLEDIDEKSGFELAAADQRPRDVQYNAAIPIETFDFIIALTAQRRNRLPMLQDRRQRRNSTARST